MSESLFSPAKLFSIFYIPPSPLNCCYVRLFLLKTLGKCLDVLFIQWLTLEGPASANRVILSGTPILHSIVLM